MNATLSVQDLWSQILALPAGDRRWLLDKLNVYEEQEEALTPYTMEELNARIERSLADAEAGYAGDMEHGGCSATGQAA